MRTSLPTFQDLRINDTRLLSLIEGDGVGALASAFIGNELIATYQDVGDGSEPHVRFKDTQARAMFADAVARHRINEQMDAMHKAKGVFTYGKRTLEQTLSAYIEQALSLQLTKFRTPQQNQMKRNLFVGLSVSILLINIALVTVFTLKGEGAEHTGLGILCGAALLASAVKAHEYARLNRHQTKALTCALQEHPEIARNIATFTDRGAEITQANFNDIMTACKRETQRNDPTFADSQKGHV